MSRDETTYVADMVEACSRVMEYTAGFDAVGLRGDRRTVDAFVRNLEVLDLDIVCDAALVKVPSLHVALENLLRQLEGGAAK